MSREIKFNGKYIVEHGDDECTFRNAFIVPDNYSRHSDMYALMLAEAEKDFGQKLPEHECLVVSESNWCLHFPCLRIAVHDIKKNPEGWIVTREKPFGTR